MIRFVICVDVDEDNLKAAYLKLATELSKIPSIEWESSDEAYDDDGEEIDPDILQDIRMRVLKDALKVADESN